MFTPQFSEEPVVVLFGASYANKQAPDASPFAGGALNNFSYFDLEAALIREGLTIRNEAQGGATSYDQPEAGWRGIMTQVDRALQYTPIWPDRSVAGIFTLLNDCLHGTYCSHSDMDAFLQLVYDAAEKWHIAGKKVIIHALPEWGSLRLPEAMSIYFPPDYYTISEADHLVLQNKQKEKFENVEWINFIYPWEKAGVFPDGLHPGPDDMKKTASIDAKILKDLGIK